jgi:inosose dehydratase
VTPSALPVKLATGPVTWGVDFADRPGNPPWSLVLDEIEASGIGALELGPVGYLPEDPATLRAELERRHLTAVGSYVFEDLHDPDETKTVMAVAERACRAIAAAGGAVLVIIDRPDEYRVATAGRADVAPRLSDERWAAMLDLVDQVARVAREAGLRPVVHPHAGGYIEFGDEVERLIDDTDLDLCIDSGHFAYAGIDPVRAIRSYADRLGHFHFKDVRPDVIDRVRAEGLDFWTAIEEGVFCPMGEGLVDVAGVIGALADVGYAGYATIEQDRVAGSGTPLQDLQRSVAVLERLGRA